MRRRAGPSEIGRLAAPLASFLDAIWQRMHWWVAIMGFLYLCSGITVVKPDEVALILRWGRLVGKGEEAQHGPGLLFAFPKPVDEVLRVKRMRVEEERVSTLVAGRYASQTLDPVNDGYALTGDHNIVHVDVVVRYRIEDPALWKFYGPDSREILRLEVTGAMVRSLGEMGIDRVLSDGRKDLIATARRRAQEGLDAASSGLTITSLELTGLAPPVALQPSFDAVQSAFIGAETAKKDAQAYAATAVPNAQAEANRVIEDARARTGDKEAAARGEAQAFLNLEKEYRANPAVVGERLYRDAIIQALSRAQVDWIPPPVGGHYNGLRITVQQGSAGGQPAFGDDE